MCVCVCAVYSTLPMGRDAKGSTGFCGGRRCWASEWPQSRVCSSTCTSQRCSRSGRSCTDWREVPLLHTRQCLQDTHTHGDKDTQALVHEFQEYNLDLVSCLRSRLHWQFRAIMALSAGQMIECSLLFLLLRSPPNFMHNKHHKCIQRCKK